MINLIKILNFLHEAEKLKTIKRKVSISDNSRKESPAEHTWRMCLMIILLVKELKLEVDIEKTLKIAILHDLVEVYAWDEWIINKNDIDKINTIKQKETESAEKIFSLLPNNISDEFKKCWLEYEEWNTKESKFVKAIDKIEVIIQRIDLWVKNFERHDIYDVLLSWADKPVNNFPELDNFWELVKKELKNQINNYNQ